MGNLAGVESPKSGISKPRIILIGVALFIFLLLGLWFAGAQAWRDTASDVRTQSQQALKLRSQVLNVDIKQKRLDAIHSLANLKRNEASCDGQWWFAWQKNLSDTAKKAAKSCESDDTSLKKVTDAASKLTSYLADEATITKKLDRLKIDPKKTDWQVDAAKAASTVTSELKKLKVQEATKPVLTESVTRVETISKAWSALQTASSKQNRSEYETALTNLQDAYAVLGSVPDRSDKGITDIIANF